MSFLKGLGGVLGGMSAGYADPTFVARKKAEEDLLRQRHEQAKGLMDYEEKLRRDAKDREEAEIVSSLATTLPNESQAPGVLPPRDPMANAQLARNEAKAASSLKSMGGARRLRGGLGLQEDIGRVGAEGELARGKFDLASTAALVPKAGMSALASQERQIAEANAGQIEAGNREDRARYQSMDIPNEVALERKNREVGLAKAEEALKDIAQNEGLRAETAKLLKDKLQEESLNTQTRATINEIRWLILHNEPLEKFSEEQKVILGLTLQGWPQNRIDATNRSGSSPLLGGVVSSIREGKGGVFRSPTQSPGGTSSVPQATPSQSSMSPEEEEKERLRRLFGQQFVSSGP